jgi:hypothetical protein
LLDPARSSFGWNWTFWNGTLGPLVAEIGARSPLGPALVAAGSTRRLVTNDPTTQAITRTDTSRGGIRELWVIAAGDGLGTRAVTIRGLERMIGVGMVYEEGRRIRLTRGSLTDRFRQWEVHVYRFRLAGPAAVDSTAS